MMKIPSDSRELDVWLFRLGWVAAAGALAVGAIGYALGWNTTGGHRFGSNIVPASLFGAGILIFLSLAWGVIRGVASLAFLARVCILALAGLSAVQTLAFLRNVKPLIMLRADLAMGSESQFVDQIIRYRAGAPQYTPAEDANSTAYSPGAPMLTYWLAKAIGKPDSIPAYRVMQLLYVCVAAGLCAWATWLLVGYLQPKNPNRFLWLLFWLPFMLLMGINQQTNVYTLVLYSDALGLAANAAAFWLLIRHLTSGDARWLVPMAVIPGVGFLAKQKEVVWAGLYALYLFLDDKTPFRRIVIFTLCAFASAALAVALCYALWGDAFWYWNFTVLNRLKVALLRVALQTGNAALYLLPGAVGGLLLARARYFKQVAPIFVVWVLHAVISAYTSGIAYRPAHLGPATMAGCVLFLAGIAVNWPRMGEQESGTDREVSIATIDPGWRALLATGCIAFYALSALEIRSTPSVPAKMEEFIQAIEKEFEGVDRQKVLIDTGSWVYLPENIVMKDRESPLGTLGGTGAYDLTATADRIRAQHYDKILLHKRMYFFWIAKLRDPINEAYEEVRTIPGVDVPQTGWFYTPLLSDVGVYVPRKREAASAPAATPAPVR